MHTDVCTFAARDSVPSCIGNERTLMIGLYSQRRRLSTRATAHLAAIMTPA